MTGKTVPIAALLLLVSGACALAQSQNPTCQRLEAQLASLDRGNDDPTRADRIRRAEDAVSRQQFEVDKLVAQSRRMNCESGGFFSIFSAPSPKCEPLQDQVQQARGTLQRTQNELEQLHGGTTERMGQRRSILIALGDNACGPQYRQAAASAQQGGFFERLLGGNSGFFGNSSGDSFRTICVRTCDGYFFPISFATTQSRFRDDEQTCQRMCPAAEVSLFTYRNPGEEVSQAMSLGGRPYTELPNAFRYRTAFDRSCSCRQAGQTWADALKTNTDTTLEQGDVVVTEERAKRLSQPRTDAAGKPIRPAAPAARAADAATAAPAQSADKPADAAPGKTPVRTVGPTFYPVR